LKEFLKSKGRIMEKYNNILFVQLTTSKWYRRAENYRLTKIPPIGLLTISSYLRMNGVKNVQVIDFAFSQYSKESFENLLKTNKIEVVGLSIYSESYRHAIDMANFIKKVNPNIKIVAGGAFVTFIADELLQQPAFDFVVLGEGEITMLELLLSLNYPDQLPLKNIQGLAFRDENNQITQNPRRAPIKNLNVLPFMDRSQDVIDFFEPSLNTSRGCPGNCIYCASRAMWGNKYRMRNAHNVFAEIFYLHHRYGNLSKLNFAEDTFTASRKRIREICRLIIDSGIKIKFWCESRVDVLTKDILKDMKDAGLLSIQIGVESGVQEIIDEINKNITLEKVEEVLTWTKELDIFRVHCGFMIGHPSDTEATIKKTIEFAHHIQ
jgi:anaerobic magnesium-protoporphyrin IX monomethyl ester cyclase